MTLEELEKRVQALEDLEEIKKLKVRYAKYIDDNFNVEKLAELFTEDAVWGGEAWGMIQGREAIVKYFAGMPKHMVFSCHRIVAPDITVEGNLQDAMAFQEIIELALEAYEDLAEDL